jgi:hypothetical protein
LACADVVPKGLSASDWSSVRAAYERHQRAVTPIRSGYRTHNPRQRWTTDFDNGGFITYPDAGNWKWGFELRSYGFPGEKRNVHHDSKIRVEGDKVIYQHDSALSEWLVNDERGLEEGFILETAPGNGDGGNVTLEFDLAFRGDLRAHLSSAGTALCFLDSDRREILTYSDLKVWDGTGKTLPAHFVLLGDGVRLVIDARGARYPITVDPIAQQAYLKASNTDANDHFGESVAISGDTLVVGAPEESSDATGINGDQMNNKADLAGAAYIFVRNGGIWTQQAYLKASNTGSADRFGSFVAISGDTVVVGAPLEDSKATGVNGDQNNNSAGDAGAAYVFVRSGGTWTQQAYLKASNTENQDEFGISVSISGETAVVGAFQEDSSATGINGDQADNSAPRAGSAYVFLRSGATWTQQAYLKASNTEAGDGFGDAVAISGDTVVVTAVSEDSNATGVNGDQSDNSANDAGAAYVFARSGVTWAQQAYLKASNTGFGDAFGRSVALSGDTAVVGAFFEDSDATGVDGDQGDNSADNSGAAYVFARSGVTWTQQAYLKASNTDAGDGFGFSVGISGELVVVGAPVESSSATGINGDQNNGGAYASGAAYLFVRSGATWMQQTYLKASNTDSDDQFAFSAAVSGSVVAVGALIEDSSATGINGDQTDNSTSGSGAVYVFTGSPTTLGNISTRGRVETGDDVLIGGFIIAGAAPTQVLLRGIGPSLPLEGALADPILELHDGAGTLIARNDNWVNSPNKQAIIDTKIPPSDDRESAILRTLDPGPYTAILRGVNNTTGIGLIEAYDLDPAAGSELANISTRGLVRTGDNVMIGGFILVGPSPQEVLVRAIGPSLPVSGKLADPTLELFDGNGVLIASNDDWRDTQEAEIMATTIPPKRDAESAVLETLPPAAYTAIVRGKNETTGVALVEVYQLDN